MILRLRDYWPGDPIAFAREGDDDTVVVDATVEGWLAATVEVVVSAVVATGSAVPDASPAAFEVPNFCLFSKKIN